MGLSRGYIYIYMYIYIYVYRGIILGIHREWLVLMDKVMEGTVLELFGLNASLFSLRRNG